MTRNNTLSLTFFALTLLGSSQDEYDSLSHQLWTKGASVVNATYNYQDAVRFIHEDPKAIHNWASDTEEKAFCSLVHRASWGRVWTLGFFYSLNALFIRDEILPLFQKNDYVLIPFWGPISESNEIHKGLMQKAKYPQNIFFLANSDRCRDILRDEGVQAYTVSHNAFIDPETFSIKNVRKEYKAAFLGCCRPQKRPELTSLVLPDLTVITHSNEKQRELVSHAKNITFNPPHEKIAEEICKADSGLILSATEGGCYSSTEYLYCGLPVISTKSTGGRDAYYDESNSIIVDDTPESVKDAVDLVHKKNYDPNKIREGALKVSDQMLDTLAYEILQPIFSKHKDPYAKRPKDFVLKKISQSKNRMSKGRTCFQPECPTHSSKELIQKAQKPKKKKRFLHFWKS